MTDGKTAHEFSMLIYWHRHMTHMSTDATSSLPFIQFRRLVWNVIITRLFRSGV